VSAIELRKNGHLLDSSDGQLKLSADVEDFWFDLQIGFWTLQFLGTTGMTLTVAHGRTGATLLSQRYQGSHKAERMAGYEGTWEEVMNAALERMMRDVATDSQARRGLQEPLSYRWAPMQTPVRESQVAPPAA
jgi:hypothetical protein